MALGDIQREAYSNASTMFTVPVLALFFTRLPAHILLIAILLIFQPFFIFAIAYGSAWLLKIPHCTPLRQDSTYRIQ